MPEIAFLQRGKRNKSVYFVDRGDVRRRRTPGRRYRKGDMALHIKYGKLFGGDKVLWIIILLLAAISVLVVYSSTASMAYKEMDGNTGYYLGRQLRFILIGFLFTFVFHLFDYQLYLRIGKPLFTASVVLVCLTFFGGVSYNEASRWLHIPFTNFTFQPSDVLKITLVIALANQLAVRQKIIHRIPILPSLSVTGWNRNSRKNSDIFFRTTLPVLGPVALACFLVLFSNFSTAAIIFTACLILLIIGRVRWVEIWRILKVTVVTLVLALALFKVFHVGRVDTWINRITDYVGVTRDAAGRNEEEEEGDVFQVEQAKIAIASGWLLGKGPGNSTQRTNLPHPYSDYAYAFIVEEYGILGALVVMGCYLWIFYRAILIFRRCEKVFPSLLVLGLSLIITMQALINMAVATDLLPVTGQTLPLISLGGSSLVFTSISLGIILGVSRQLQDIREARRIEQNRRDVDEWGHLVINETVKKTESDETETFKYDGVIFRPKDKSDS